MRRFWSRLASLVRRRQLDDEMDEEIAAHLDLATADLQSRGLGSQEAFHAARRHFGSVTNAKDAERDSRGFPLLEDAVRDTRYAFRGLRRNPVMAVVIVSILAIGIGSTATIFSAVDAVLLKSLPITNPDRVVSVHTLWDAQATASLGGGNQLGTMSFPNYVDLRDSGILQGFTAYAPIVLTLDADGTSDRIDGQIVTANYFDVLGVRPIVGRGFLPAEDHIDAPVRVAVLSYTAWLRRYGQRPDIVGRSITLNGNPYTVIGVAPRGFFGSTLGDDPELWVPMALQPEVRPASAGALRQRMSISTSGTT